MTKYPDCGRPRAFREPAKQNFLDQPVPRCVAREDDDDTAERGDLLRSAAHPFQRAPGGFALIPEVFGADVRHLRCLRAPRSTPAGSVPARTAAGTPSHHHTDFLIEDCCITRPQSAASGS